MIDNDNDTRIKPYLPLNELEKIFNDVYRQSSEFKKTKLLQYYYNSISDHKVADMFQGIVRMKGFIPENIFFQNNENISVNRHPRFMPAHEHKHDFFEIQYVLKGTVKQSINGVSIGLNAGDICFISPSASHNPEVNDTDTILVNILLRSKTLRSAFSNCLADDDIIATFFMRILCGQTYHPYLLWHTNHDESISTLIFDMLDCVKKSDGYTDRLLHTMVEQLFIYLLRDHSKDFSTNTFQKKDDENILSIIKYAQANSATITLSKLSAHFNYNEAYLSRMLKTYLGCSFSEYFIDMRLKTAAHLLVETVYPVSEILIQVGYSDKTHFYRSFHKKYSMTPLQFRKENQVFPKAKIIHNYMK
jgi:AraC-like DNA-binding protein/mannose-6-phosphate isomerase-like protein (cupin superfamily)